MRRAGGIIALICGALAIILGSLCFIVGVGIVSLVTIGLFISSFIFGRPALNKNTPKDAPGYKLCVIGVILGYIAFFEVLASLLLTYL